MTDADTPDELVPCIDCGSVACQGDCWVDPDDYASPIVTVAPTGTYL